MSTCCLVDVVICSNKTPHFGYKSENLKLLNLLSLITKLTFPSHFFKTHFVGVKTWKSGAIITVSAYVKSKGEMLALLCVYPWMFARAIERARKRISNVINGRACV